VALTNREVREWYRQRIAPIPERDLQWQQEGVPLADRARRAWEIRRRARVEARALMTDSIAVAKLEQRDLMKYGNPGGPSFEQLLHRNQEENGLTRDQAYEAIIASAASTDENTNRKYSQ
jgi:hypothetical protein